MNFTSNKPYLFRAILDWLLDNGATPYILVDVTKASVEVPREHVKDNQIVLNINPSAVSQWCSDNQAISFSARFSGVSRQIYVPMNALMAVYSQENGQGMVFPIDDEVNESEVAEKPVRDVKVSAPKNTNKHKTNEKPTKPSGKSSHLKVIK